MAKLKNCTRCHLHKTRKNVVVGKGNPHASIVFVGEAPGEHEDKQGKPFVGPAGRWLNKAIKVLGLSDDQYYVANILKCRPFERAHGYMNNREPTQEEISACLPWLKFQLKRIGPQVVVVLGGTAMRVLLGLQGVKKHRGRAFFENDIVYFVLLHPAVLTYDQKGEEKAYYADLLELKRLLTKLKIIEE